MNTDFDRARDREGATAFRDALGRARSHLESVRPDVVICVGSNHFRGFWLDLMPSFTIGVGDVTATGESGTPEGPLPTDPEFARHLLEHAVAHEIDLAFSVNMTIDHGISHAVQYVVPEGTPIVPVVVNDFSPPIPTLTRCLRFGEVLGEAIRSFGGDRRVAVIASGGLSHELPWPDWRSPDSEQDHLLVDAWTEGRGDWKRYDAERRSIVRGAPARINEEFDREFLDVLAGGDAAALVAKFPDLDARAGNGGAEIRNWIVATAAVRPASVDVLGYWAIPEWLTGMGAVTLHTAQPS